MSIQCFHFYTMRNTIVRYTEIQRKKNSDIQISEIQKYILPIYRNTDYSNIEIQKKGEIQLVEVQKYK